MEWTGKERRSPDSVLARSAVAARDEAEELEGQLQSLPRRRFRRRSRVNRALADARRREREAVGMLGGG